MDEELNFCPASKWSCHMSCDGIAASCIFYFYPSLFRTHLSVQSSVIIRMSHCWSWTHVNLILVMNPCEMKTRKERCDAKTTQQMLVIDTPKSSGTIFSLDVIQFSFLFSTHIDPHSISNEQNRDPAFILFLSVSPVTKNRRLVPWWCGVGGQQSAHATPACLPRSEACH